MKRIKRYLIRLSIALLAFIIGFATYLFAPPLRSSSSVVPQKRPVTLIKENTRCEAGTIYVPKKYQYADNEIVDEYCAELQKKLTIAASKGEFETISSLIAQGANPNSPYLDENGEISRPIPTAARNKHWDVVHLFLTNGGNVNDYYACCMTRLSLLMIAVEQNDIEEIRFLLARGADTKFTTYEGYAAFDIAINNGRDDIAELFDEARQVTFMQRARLRIAKLFGVSVKSVKFGK